ncbi:HNH endonuclease family protein [Streptomyces aureocirculatus]|uniref:HNH endonuclease family protein n=1 Tax=Streptomyces aureocirculatus TaxID=67275 RepID=UPI00099C6E51|nr:HNH endonuclease family protein [Streptomyces aureocirculatus]
MTISETQESAAISNEVLIDEAVTDAERTGRCTLTNGRWYSPYDDRYVEGPRTIDIDHFVPLAESWDSGASRWTPKERQAYANDLDDSRALIAVTAVSNRSKADKDPAQWVPPAAGYECTYATTWVTIKTRWQLAIDPAEADALASTLNECPNVPVRAELAR